MLPPHFHEYLQYNTWIFTPQRKLRAKALCNPESLKRIPQSDFQFISSSDNCAAHYTTAVLLHGTCTSLTGRLCTYCVCVLICHCQQLEVYMSRSGRQAGRQAIMYSYGIRAARRQQRGIQ